MQPGGTSKASRNGRRTPKGRRLLGEKGVGRFALDKLARKVELVSRCPGQKHEVFALFDWDQFASNDRMLHEVRNRWTIRRTKEIKNHGTILKLTGLRMAWNERLFRRLSTRLSRLLAPSTDMDTLTILFNRMSSLNIQASSILIF